MTPEEAKEIARGKFAGVGGYQTACAVLADALESAESRVAAALEVVEELQRRATESGFRPRQDPQTLVQAQGHAFQCAAQMLRAALTPAPGKT